MTDHDVRDLLERMVAEEPVPLLDPEPLARRGRRRAARTVLFGAVGIAAAVAVLFAGFAQIRTAPTTPAVQPTMTPSPTPTGPFTERFDSPLHGLSMGYPSGWQTRSATEPWGHGTLAFDAPDVDVIFDPKLQDDLYFIVVSEPLGGVPGHEWDNGLPSPTICTGDEGDGAGGGGGAYRLGDADGSFGSMSCGSGGAAGHSWIGATATRGYIIALHLGDERLGATYDAAWFEAALETVDLRPEDADTLNPSDPQ